MAPPHTRSDLAAALSIGAGLVHAAAAGTHSGDATLVWLFTTSALAQVLLGVALLSAPSRRLLVAVAGVNGVCVAAWALSRTAGLPLVASLAGREEVGAQDLVVRAARCGGGHGRGVGRRSARTPTPSWPAGSCGSGARPGAGRHRRGGSARARRSRPR